MKSLKIKFHLDAPVILNRFTTIDAILLKEFYKKSNSLDIINPYEDKNTDFLAKENGNISGSIWFIEENAPIIFYNAVLTKAPKKEVYAKYLKSKVNINNVGAGSGEYKSFRLPFECLIIPELYFYIKGERNVIENLCRKVKFIGSKNRVGFGKVKGFEIEEISEDKSFLLNDYTPAKPLTMEWNLKNDRIAVFSAVPPYWLKANRQLCYMPHTSLVEKLDESEVKGKTALNVPLSNSKFIYDALNQHLVFEMKKIRGVQWVEDNKERYCMGCGQIYKEGYLILDTANIMKKLRGGLFSGNFMDFPYLNVANTNFLCKYCYMAGKNFDFISKRMEVFINQKGIYEFKEKIKKNQKNKKSSSGPDKRKLSFEEDLNFHHPNDILLNLDKLEPPYFLAFKTTTNKQHVAWKGVPTVSNLMPVITYGNLIPAYVDTVLYRKAFEEMNEIVKKYEEYGIYPDTLTNRGFNKPSGSGKTERLDFPMPNMKKLMKKKEAYKELQNFWRKYDRAIRMTLYKITSEGKKN